MTIPTTENGEVSTFVVQDGFVFDSGAGMKFEFSTICVISFSLFAWSEGEVVTWLEQWDDYGRPNACGVRCCLTKNG